LTPTEKKARRNAVASGHLVNVRARHQRFFHKQHLLVGRPPSPLLNTAKDLNPRQSILKLAGRSQAQAKVEVKQGAGRNRTLNGRNRHEIVDAPHPAF